MWLPIGVTMLPCGHDGMKAPRALKTPQKPFQHPFYNAATDGTKKVLDPSVKQNQLRPWLR